VFLYNDALQPDHIVERLMITVLVICGLCLLTYGEDIMRKIIESITIELIVYLLLSYLGLEQAAGVE